MNNILMKECIFDDKIQKRLNQSNKSLPQCVSIEDIPEFTPQWSTQHIGAHIYHDVNYVSPGQKASFNSLYVSKSIYIFYYVFIYLMLNEKIR